MTVGVAVHDGERSVQAMVGLTLGLALGIAEPAPADDVDWRAVLLVAVRERCAPLAWLRSGAVIRRQAPATVVATWRASAVRADSLGRDRLQALVDVTGALEAAEASPVILKGMPLAARLYGDPFVRETADADVHVPAERRAAAATALEALGWTRQSGEAPWEETWTLAGRSETHYLDLHSSLLDHNLAHLRLPPPEGDAVSLGGHAVRAHAGPLVPVFLATHLAKHRLAPLLWFVDFLTLWERLDEATRDTAWRLARSARLGGYLRWAVERAEAVRRLAAGDAHAAPLLGLAGRERSDAHPALRDARLAASPADAAQAVAAWVWPPPLRGDAAAFWRRCVGRVRSVRRPPQGRERYGLS